MNTSFLSCMLSFPICGLYSRLVRWFEPLDHFVCWYEENYPFSFSGGSSDSELFVMSICVGYANFDIVYGHRSFDLRCGLFVRPRNYESDKYWNCIFCWTFNFSLFLRWVVLFLQVEISVGVLVFSRHTFLGEECWCCLCSRWGGFWVLDS
jgi:hypothetical protein